jgi:hypothetical protein
MATRRAIITGGADSLEQVQRYLPVNYTARLSHLLPAQAFNEDGRSIPAYAVLIEGEDVAGWTLEDYVLPRLASGLIVAREFTAEGAIL